MKAVLNSVIKETENVYSYFFETEKSIEYNPGQFAYLTLPLLHYPDIRGNIRHFSICSSPTEGSLIRLTIQNGLSGFKKTLMNLSKGAEADIDAPHGIYLWEPGIHQKHVFIAGGIGVTPFRSRIKYNYDTSSEVDVTLLYSTKTVESALFHKELETISTKLNNFKFYLNISSESGRINKDYINQRCKTKNDTVFWVCGLPKMVDDVEEMLLEIGVVSEFIKTEKFTGY